MSITSILDSIIFITMIIFFFLRSSSFLGYVNALSYVVEISHNLVRNQLYK